MKSNNPIKLSLAQRIYMFFFFMVPWRIERWINVRKIHTHRGYRSGAILGKNVKINGPFRGLGSNVSIGDYTSLNPHAVFLGQGEISIGKYVHIAQHVTLISTNHNYDTADAIPYDTTRIDEPISIGDYVWIGHGAIVLPGVTIDEGAIIGAGAVVTKDVPRCAIAAGNPARVVKHRDVENFDRLKNEGKFFQ